MSDTENNTYEPSGLGEFPIVGSRCPWTCSDWFGSLPGSAIDVSDLMNESK